MEDQRRSKFMSNYTIYNS